MVDSVTQEVDQQQSNPGTATGTPIPLDTPLLQTPSVASPELWSPQFCSQAVHNVIMQDYLNIIYPLVPVVHRPTFLEDLRSNRYIRDQTFHSFCLAISGLVLGILPNKFDEYKQIDGSLPYPNRREAAKHIRTLIIQGRPADYFDEHTREKWAISYMMSVSDGHFGHVNRAKMLFAETAAICYELGLHRISNYAGLDKIESQLRKKAFWLNFTSYTFVLFIACKWTQLTLKFRHVRAHQIQWDSISDRLIFESADAELLMPLEVDDEYITAENILLQPQGRPSVVVGFNALTRINNCLVTIFRDPTLPVLSSEEMNTNPRCALGRCKCGRHIQPASMTSLIQGRLRKVKHVLDDIPTELGTWSSPNEHSPARAPDILTSQYESMKANIHVTHLWVQSLLLERLIIASGDRHNSHTSDFPNHQQIWEMREDICRQLLCLLNKISQANLEPNGYFLVRFLPFILRQPKGTDVCGRSGYEDTRSCCMLTGLPFRRTRSCLGTSQDVYPELCRHPLKIG